MKRLPVTTACLLGAALAAATALAVVPTGPPAAAQPPPEPRQEIVVEPHPGIDIYRHTTDTDYRTGPALLKSSNGLVYQYNCGPNPNGPGEVIRTATSYTNGTTWGTESLGLRPTPNSGDAIGVCDPTVLKLDNYFYLAYTGLAPNGTRQLFAARSSTPLGPFTKWNGTTWNGGTPQPLATWTSQAAGPSLINRLGTLSLYYNTRTTTGPATGTYQTRLATAPLGTTPTEHATWPQRLTPDPGTAIDHPGKYTSYDCVGTHWWADTDVKYDEATNTWLAITTDQTTYPWSALQAYQSLDGGHTFTKTVITRADYKPGARTPGQLADPNGHITPNSLRAIAYAHSTGCGQADLHYSPTTTPPVTTGAIHQPLSTGGAADWHPDSGEWGYLPGEGLIQEDSTAGFVAETSLVDRVAGSSSTFSVRMRGSGGSGWMGVHFAKEHPDDTIDQSGYVAYVSSRYGDPQVCLTKAGFGTLACAPATGVKAQRWFNLRVVQSGSGIKAYVDGNPAAGVAVTDADHPYLGGYLGLVTYQFMAQFNTFDAGDNVPGTSTTNDWTENGGDWVVGESTKVANALNDGQVNLQTDQGLDKQIPSQLGDGTYAASVRIASGADPRAWAGLTLTNNAVTGSYRTGGYLVFLRADGNLGIFKAGSGQVVADIATGTNPSSGSVQLRVLKTGANFQVYVGDRPDPVVNWTDTSAPAWAIGGFGLANLMAPATFTEPSYHGDDAR